MAGPHRLACRPSPPAAASAHSWPCRRPSPGQQPWLQQRVARRLAARRHTRLKLPGLHGRLLPALLPPGPRSGLGPAAGCTSCAQHAPGPARDIARQAAAAAADTPPHVVSRRVLHPQAMLTCLDVVWAALSSTQPQVTRTCPCSCVALPPAAACAAGVSCCCTDCCRRSRCFCSTPGSPWLSALDRLLANRMPLITVSTSRILTCTQQQAPAMTTDTHCTLGHACSSSVSGHPVLVSPQPGPVFAPTDNQHVCTPLGDPTAAVPNKSW